MTPFRILSGAGAKSPLGRILGVREGVDVRADSVFAVAPPTPGYAWIADEDEPFPELPRLWRAAICGLGDSPVVVPLVTYVPQAADERRVERARKYLAKMPASIEGSGGSDALITAVLALRVGFDLVVGTRARAQAR